MLTTIVQINSKTTNLDSGIVASVLSMRKELFYLAPRGFVGVGDGYTVV